MDADIAALIGGAPAGDTMSEVELADLLGLSTRSIRELSQRSLITKAAPGRYLIRESVRAYCANLRDAAGARSSSTTLTAERIRVAREQADALVMKNAAARGELVPATEVARTWSAILRDIRAAMLAVPARVQQRLGNLNFHDVDTIDREIRDTLEELAGDGAAITA